MPRFHINKKGVPAPCRAKSGNCPLGGDEQHFNTQAEAQAAVDEKNKQTFGILNLDDKVKLQKLAEDLDYIDDEVLFLAWRSAPIIGEKYGNYNHMADSYPELNNYLKSIFGEDAQKIVTIHEDDEEPLSYYRDPSEECHATFDSIVEDERNKGLFLEKEDEWELRPEASEAINKFLKEHEGPEIEVLGRKMKSIAHSRELKQFLMAYAASKRESAVEAEKEFKSKFDKNSEVYMTVDVEGGTSPLEKHFNDVFHEGNYWNSDEITNRPYNGKYHIVEDVPPLNYFKYSKDNPAVQSAIEKHKEAIMTSDGKDFTEDFKKKFYRNLYLSEGPPAEVFGRKFKVIPSPDKIAETIESTVKYGAWW